MRPLLKVREAGTNNWVTLECKCPPDRQAVCCGLMYGYAQPPDCLEVALNKGPRRPFESRAEELADGERRWGDRPGLLANNARTINEIWDRIDAYTPEEREHHFDVMSGRWFQREMQAIKARVSRESKVT